MLTAFGTVSVFVRSGTEVKIFEFNVNSRLSGLCPFSNAMRTQCTEVPGFEYLNIPGKGKSSRIALQGESFGVVLILDFLPTAVFHETRQNRSDTNSAKFR
jgi:hypothetical protein